MQRSGFYHNIIDKGELIMLIIKNGVIHDAIHPIPYTADILIEDKKIIHIDQNIQESDAEIFDAAGLDTYPGFIDAHSHLGVFGLSGQATKDDAEKNDPVTPHHRGIDCVNPLAFTFPKALQAGVTCVCTGPGSVGVIAGTHVAMKTSGYHLDKMIVKNPVAMKAAVGENPKTHMSKFITTRLTIAALIRDTLLQAKEYKAKKDAAVENNSTKPPYSPKLEALIPVIEKKIPLKVHGYRVDDLQTVIRIAKECDIEITLEHAADAYMLADELAKDKIPVAVGPFFTQPKRSETENKSPEHAVELFRAGVCVSVTTDDPAISSEYLALSAGLLMREGLSEFEALQTITVNPAKHLRIEDRLGSITVGKDADFVLAKGCPMQVTVKPEAVFVDGSLVYQRGK